MVSLQSILSAHTHTHTHTSLIHNTQEGDAERVWCCQGRQRLTCRFTCHPCVKRYEHKRKACLPHTPKRIISAFTCTVNIHVDVKSEKRNCTRGVPHIYPFTPHGYLPTLLQAIHSPDGTKESISFEMITQMITWIRKSRIP